MTGLLRDFDGLKRAGDVGIVRIARPVTELQIAVAHRVGAGDLPNQSLRVGLRAKRLRELCGRVWQLLFFRSSGLYQAPRYQSRTMLRARNFISSALPFTLATILGADWIVLGELQQFAE